jgi:hypothetical protein
MNNPTVNTVWEAFDRVDIAGRPMAECKLCHHQIVPNRGTMCMHYRMKHCKPYDNSGQSEPLARKPLCDQSRTFTPPTSSREMCTDRCTQVWQRYMGDISKENGDTTDTHSVSSAASESKLRRRYRTLNMLRYLAAEPTGGAYAAIIENADDQIIRAIRDVGRAFIQGSLGDLSPVESLALSRYKKSIEGVVYASSVECARKALLKPRRARGRVPGSAVYVPMLLTLALTRGGLDTYVDDDGSDVSSFTTADFEGSRESSSDDNQHSSANWDSEGSTNEASEDMSEHAIDDSGDQNEEGSDEAAAEQREQSDEGNNETSTEQSDQSDEGSEEDNAEQSDIREEGSEKASTDQSDADGEESEEADDEESESGSQESGDGDDEETESGSEESGEGDEEETESGSEESEEVTESGSEESEEGNEEETESGSQEGEDAEPDESEESEEIDPDEEEDEEGEAQSEDEDQADQQPVKNLKRRHAELSSLDTWVKRSRQY